MNDLEYFRYAIKKRFLSKINWYSTFFNIMFKDGFENEYLKISGDKIFLKVEGDVIEAKWWVKDTPLLNHKDVIELSKEDLPNIKTSVRTTIGICIANYILLCKPFKDKIPYVNDEISIGKLESVIAEDLSLGKTITIEEYISFVNARTFLSRLSRIFTISATEKTILPPKTIISDKKKIIEEMNKKYGDSWKKDRVKIVEFQEKLKEKYKEYVKDDPTYGKFLSGKVLNNAAPKKYLAFGAEVAFDNAGNNVQLTEESLLEEYPNDSKKLATMFNSSRSASFDRGNETQKGGTVAKYVLRAANSVVIDTEDCGVKVGKKVLVTENNIKMLIGRYIIISGKSILLEDKSAVEKYLNKYIVIRSPQRCLAKNNNLCKICTGKLLAEHKNGVSLVVTDISSSVLNESLKKMHNSNITLAKLDITKVIF